MPQKYPPENGQGWYRFQRWYVDEVTGHMMPEERATRDLEGRLVDAEDMDQPARDDLMEDWVLPVDDVLSEDPLE